ncbi:hypothetical protein ILYODFUR_026677 [Ilyodon furcidens]|uniref:Uncharacterized protein n=1 Tax=Ilyodon furcidens TaxID=33524 RepID=A0ABV0SPG1_9TELE
MDKSSKNPEEDRVSLQSDGKVQTNGVVKEALGMLQSFKQSMRRPTEKSPCSPKSKDSKVREKAQANGSESVSSPPQPSPRSWGSWCLSSSLRARGGVTLDRSPIHHRATGGYEYLCK